jgi:two-component system NtrC family sensor kinase
LSDRDYVRAQVDPATAGPFIGRTITARANGLRVIPYSRPRLDQDGRPDGGVLWATIRTDELAPYYDTLLQHPEDAILLVRPDGTVLIRHPAMAGDDGTHLTGWGEDTLWEASDPPGRTVLAPGLPPMDGQARLYALRQLANVPLVVVYGQHPAGPWSAWMRRVALIGLVSGGTMAVLSWVTWVTSRRAARQAEVRAAAEARLRGAERLSALGQVTAGGAHDIRNLALSVQGRAKLIRQALARGDRDRVSMVAEMLDETAGRGASLTERGWCASSGAARPRRAPWRRSIPLQPSPERRFCSRRSSAAAGRCAPTRCRPTCPTASGAIRLSVAAERVRPGEGYPAKLAPGLYARIMASGSGAGIDEEIIDRVGQAFFTTKGEGQGTGLGLSSAAAFARTAGGAMRVESPGPGRGTAVTLWLPEAPAGAS